MIINNFLKLQVFALLFSAIISPLSALADTNSKPATIKFILGTKEALDYQKASCPPYYLGSTITGVGTGTITENRKSTLLGVLSFKADDCITPMENYFISKGSWTLSGRNGNNITGNYSVSFVPTDNPQIYTYVDFILHITGGTGLFTGATGSGIAEGASNIQTGLGVVEGTLNISK
jgi:hypothetical protein